MGYELHIHRPSQPISQQEWEAYVQKDSSLTREEAHSTLYFWQAHPLGGIEGETPWLHFSQNRISTRKPDSFLSLKMFEIAEALQAVLSNDEAPLDALYREELWEETQHSLRQSNSSKQPWWKFW